MKKIQLSILLLLLLGMAACKKEQNNPATMAKKKSNQEQVADLIQRGDPAMYDRIYGNNTKAAEPSVHIHYGVFICVPSHPQDGTCHGETGVCCICVVQPRLVTDETPVEEITGNISWSWAHSDEAELILGDSAATTIPELKSLDLQHDQYGDAAFSWSTY